MDASLLVNIMNINDSTKMSERSHVRESMSLFLDVIFLLLPIVLFSQIVSDLSLPSEAAKDTVLDRNKPDGLITSDLAAKGNLRGWKQFELKTHGWTQILYAFHPPANKHYDFQEALDIS